MLRILRYLKGSKAAVLAIVILLMIQAYCDLSLPQYTSDIVDVGIQQGGIELPNKDASLDSQRELLELRAQYEAQGVDLAKLQTDYLLRKGGEMLALSLVMVVAAVLVGLLAARTAAKVGMELRSSVYKKVISFSGGELDKFSTASLITRTTNDIQQVQMVSVMLLRMVAYAPILGIGGIVKVMGTNTGMSWIIVVAVGSMILLVSVLMSLAMPRFKKMQTLVDKLNLISREIVTGIPVIRAFSREEHEEKRFAEASGDLMKTQLFTNRVMTFMQPCMMLIMNAITVLIIWVGAQGIDMGTLQVGDMMAFITYTMQIVMSFLMLTMVSVMIPRAGVAAARIDEVLNTQVSVADSEQVRDSELAHPRGTLSFENVSFRYPDAEENVLNNISFTANRGETTAIIGSTGSGKSTLLNLIPRFYDVTEGRITVDGIDIREISQHKLRSMLGLVPQKGVLFSGTIESNIQFSGEVSEEAMAKAADIAQAAPFIAEKPEGYKTPIAQGGTNVSGGQKQRLAIARAIAKQPPIVLFDDSFSALDYKTDAALRRALTEQLTDATVIIVAQRISTILHAQCIIVLDEGSVAGIGTHAELLKSCEAYREIAKSQLSEKELEGGAGR
ncbi:MAG: ABC transporter ATP-binding protein [Angelakisella sp.]